MKNKKISKILILGIAIYFVFQISIFLIGENTRTMAVELEDMELKINTKGLVIKDESVIVSNADGTFKNLHEEGEKVQKSENIGYIYKDIDIEKINSDIENLDKEINKLKEQIDSQDNSTLKHITANQLENSKNKKAILEKKAKSSTSYVKADISGVISYKIDENEGKYNTDSIDYLIKDDIENTNNNYTDINSNDKKIKENDPVFKIVNPNDVYIAVCIEEKYRKYFEVGNKIEISFNEEILDGKVNKVKKDNDDIIVILKITSQNIGIYDTRVEEFDIIYKHIEGFKIPKKSIKSVDKKKGVYILNQQTNNMEFVELSDVAYEADDYIFVKNDSSDKEKVIALHDEVVLNPNIINKKIKIK